MADRKADTFGLQGVVLDAAGHRTGRGACRILEGLVPTARQGQTTWEVPPSATAQAPSGLLSLGRHDKGRLLGLREGELVLIDPAAGYAEAQVWSFPSNDNTRRATFARASGSTFVAVTSGSDPGTPEVLLEVRGTTATPVQWPPLPVMEVDAMAGDLGPGSVLLRVAWELEDGTVGPASPPVMERRLNNPYGVRARVLRQPDPIPASWAQQIQHLLLIVQVPSFESLDAEQSRTKRTTTLPINNPPKIARRAKNYAPGETYELKLSNEDLLAKETYDGTGLKAHEVEAGAVYSYNNRLICGDTTYQLHRPQLEAILEWESGVQNSGGNDYWLTLEVTVQTQEGDATVYADPLPFDATAITQVQTRASVNDPFITSQKGYPHGYLAYPDVRAKSFRWLVSTDYAGDLEAATWEEATTPGSDRTFKTPTAASFAVADIAPGEPYDMTNRSGATVDPLGHHQFETSNDEQAPTVTFRPPSDDSMLDNGVVQNGSKDVTKEETVTDSFEFSRLDPVGGSVPTEVRFDWGTEGSLDTNNDADARYNLSLSVEVLDEGGTALDSFSTGDSGSGSAVNNTKSGSVTLNSFTPADADRIKIFHDVSVTVSPSGSFASGGTETRVVNMEVDLDVPALSGSESLTRGAEDANPSRLIWSSPNQPLDLQVENVAYAGEDERVMAMQATGQEVSAAQFGEFPIVLFTDTAARIMRVGPGTPFVEGVDLLTGDAGIVGRRAVTAADGAVVAALRNGVRLFEPQPRSPALSQRLHDPGGDVLGSFDDRDLALTHYEDRARGRSEIWVSADDLTWVYSTTHDAWSVLVQGRKDFTLREGTYEAVTSSGDLVVEETDTASLRHVRIQTAVMPLGALGQIKRVREVQLRQPVPLAEVELSAIATDPDPNNPYVNLGTATLKDHEINFGLPLAGGLAPGLVVDVAGDGEPGEMVEAMTVEWDARDRYLRDHQGHGTPGYDTTVASPTLALTKVNP